MNARKRLPLRAVLSRGCLALLALALSGASAWAQDFQVRDNTGAALDDAVVYLTPEDGKVPAGRPAPASIVQKQKMFMPMVTVVQKGAAVDFPNRDDIAHDVYSLSDAKRFELKLYRGGSRQVVFDKPGVVTIGCNIHDMMIAYVVVVDTPYFAKTGGGGRGELPTVPAGRYRVAVWHPRLGSAPATVVGTFQLPGAAPAAPGVTVAPLSLVLPLRGD
ncbi:MULTISPECIES: methylamine utilization protein [Pandoraea]|uniref:methylamine utilization protein n=1 Tax=Pandoraea TaxID=93217 RepID=UPI001F5DF6EB|nr:MULTISPECIES: methylamine utilization protein [Pandoraea]MCI3206919.1 methylamine utilization protein [Pandoraea sp. LA3]MDN4584947.1 methylamine utilization protein [Pandoraea capi]